VFEIRLEKCALHIRLSGISSQIVSSEAGDVLDNPRIIVDESRDEPLMTMLALTCPERLCWRRRIPKSQFAGDQQ